MVTLPLYPGYKYAAYAAINNEEVIKLIALVKSFNYLLCIFLQAGTVTFYNERPVKLVYHISSFHILDLKVINICLGYTIQPNLNLNSCVNA